MASPDFDPNWKAKLEAKRAAREEKVRKHLASLESQKKPTPPPLPEPYVKHETFPLGQGLEVRITTKGGTKKEPSAKDKAVGCLVLLFSGCLLLFWCAPDGADRARAAKARSDLADKAATISRMKTDGDSVRIFEGMDNRLAWEKKWQLKIITFEGELTQTGRAGDIPWAKFRINLGEDIHVLLAGDQTVDSVTAMKIGQKARLSCMVRGVAPDGLSIQVMSDKVEPMPNH